MGQQFGIANQIVLLIACLAIIMLTVSVGIMCWKQRPALSFGVPPMPANPLMFRGLLAILIVGGILFPLVGLSLIGTLVLDQAGSRLMSRRRYQTG